MKYLLFAVPARASLGLGVRVRADFNEAKRHLVFTAPGDGQPLFQPAAQDHNLALAASAFQPQRFVSALPAISERLSLTIKHSLHDGRDPPSRQ